MKNYKLFPLTIFVFLLQIFIFSQNRYDEMQKVIKTVEKNYSGFEVLKPVHEIEYSNFKRHILDSILVCNDIEGELKVVKTYLSFFQDNHLRAFTGDLMSFAVKEMGFKLDAPTLTAADSQTIILTIPSFIGPNKDIIENLLKSNLEKISGIKNIIIDLRGNRGGNDAAFSSLLSLIYTNDFTVYNYYILATGSSIEKYKDQFSTEKLEKVKKMARELVALTDNEPDIYVEKSEFKKSSYPLNIAVIVDRYTGSSAEQFLFYAKQSRKVKVFSENTSGTVDYTNPEMFKFFNNNITVTIPSMVSARVWNRQL